MWSEVLYRESEQPFRSKDVIRHDPPGHLTDTIAGGLYEDALSEFNLTAGVTGIFQPFSDLQQHIREIWYRFAEGIPAKLAELRLFIRPFDNFCHTCIITGPEIEMLNDIDNKTYGLLIDSDKETRPLKNSNRIEHPLSWISEKAGIEIKDKLTVLNLLIPYRLRKAGFELIRSEEVTEIDLAVVNRLARVIHKKYLQEVKNRNRSESLPGFFSGYSCSPAVYPENFDDLPVEIQHSNLDNAYHIPTKLLSIGYKLRPALKGFRTPALILGEKETESMARVEHLRWCWEKRLNGWHYGEERDNNRKIHPGLVEYEELEESEKEKDRALVRLIPALLKDIGYDAYPVAPGRISRLSYALKPQSTIQKLLSETNNLAREISAITGSSPEISERLISIRNKIEASIMEVRGSYNYASHIQEVFLPENIFIRECFPESFVLYKPKNIVSGDFYFFSKTGHLIIFALADCTGHGIPGALISTIGYGNLDQVVNVKGYTEPSSILDQLYSSIHRFLRRDLHGYGLEDDMDITLCRYNTSDNILTLAGMGNNVFHISNGQVEDIRPDHFPVEIGNSTGYKFSSWSGEMKPGDTLYIFSDGFADQFGGKNNKRYTRTRLNKFLTGIQGNSMPVQHDLLFNEIEKWRNSAGTEQTDDISAIGIKF